MTDQQINMTIARVLNADEHWMIQKNYCIDLNAMHEAEATLNEEQLSRMAREIERNDNEWYFRATARQRAEAFLRTLGKWEEVQA